MQDIIHGFWPISGNITFINIFVRAITIMIEITFFSLIFYVWNRNLKFKIIRFSWEISINIQLEMTN